MDKLLQAARRDFRKGLARGDAAAALLAIVAWRQRAPGPAQAARSPGVAETQHAQDITLREAAQAHGVDMALFDHWVRADRMV